MEFNAVDIAILSVIGISLITGLFRGFIKEIISLAMWIIGISAALIYAPKLNLGLGAYIHDPKTEVLVNFIIILAAILMLGSIVNGFLAFILRKSGLSFMDRTLGMVFGCCRGIFFVALIMVAMKITGVSYARYEKQSVLMDKFNPLVDFIYNHTSKITKQVKDLQKIDFNKSLETL